MTNQPKRLLKYTWKFLFIIVMVGVLGVGGYAAYYFFPAHYKDRVTVLEYHDISDDDGAYAITADLFRKQLMKLKKGGANFITADQFESFLQGGDVPANAVLVTFDDGLSSYMTNALPILQELDIPSIQFLISSKLSSEKQQELNLSAEQIREILMNNTNRESSRADFGCHSHNSHSKLQGKGILAGMIQRDGKTESAEQYHQRVHDDLEMCVAELEQLYESVGQLPSSSVHMLTYPFGNYDTESFPVYEAAGIHIAFTGEPRLARRDDNALLIPRIQAGVPQATPARLQYWVKRGVNRAPMKHSNYDFK